MSVSSNPAISLTCERPQQRRMEFIIFSSAPGSPVFTFPPLPLHLLLLLCFPHFPFKFMTSLQLSCYTLPLTHTLALTDIDRHTCFVHRNKVWNQFGVAHMCMTSCDWITSQVLHPLCLKCVYGVFSKRVLLSSSGRKPRRKQRLYCFGIFWTPRTNI